MADSDDKKQFPPARDAKAGKKPTPVSPKKGHSKQRPLSSLAGSPGKGVNNQNQMAAMLAALKGGA